jgi:hypothetical protein
MKQSPRQLYELHRQKLKDVIVKTAIDWYRKSDQGEPINETKALRKAVEEFLK